MTTACTTYYRHSDIATSGAATHRYYVQDYLGSVRAVFDLYGNLEQTNDYNVTGIPSSRHLGNADLHKHTGKEFQGFNGLAWYDNNARYYDPILGRFTTQDPLAEKYPWLSPYNHCANNPLKFIDPDGRDIVLVIWTSGENNGVGHAGIAISNYSGQQKENSYTYYDNWPQPIVTFNVKGATSTVEAKRNIIQIQDENSFSNGNTIVPDEDYAPNAVLKIKTSFDIDSKITQVIQDSNENNKIYNGLKYNCSTFVSDALKPLFNKNIGNECIIGFIKAVTPNQLWNDAIKEINQQGFDSKILVEPSSDVNIRFLNLFKNK